MYLEIKPWLMSLFIFTIIFGIFYSGSYLYMNSKCSQYSQLGDGYERCLSYVSDYKKVINDSYFNKIVSNKVLSNGYLSEKEYEEIIRIYNRYKEEQIEQDLIKG